MQAISNATKICYTWLITLLYPDFCIICESYGLPICTECEGRLTISSKVLSPFSLSVYDYQDKNVQKVIKAIKYNNDISLGKYISKNILNKILNLTAVKNNPYVILVPIPVHKSRERMRGYNQARILSDAAASLNIVSENKIYSKDLLKRVKATDNLYKSSSIDGRMNTLINVMELDTEYLRNFVNENQISASDLIIIIIDDLSTTGATIYEARRAILTARNDKVMITPENIYAITLAN